jgi:hypothetical protein
MTYPKQMRVCLLLPGRVVADLLGKGFHSDLKGRQSRFTVRKIDSRSKHPNVAESST